MEKFYFECIVLNKYRVRHLNINACIICLTIRAGKKDSLRSLLKKENVRWFSITDNVAYKLSSGKSEQFIITPLNEPQGT